jgi:hypothetical protein
VATFTGNGNEAYAASQIVLKIGFATHAQSVTDVRSHKVSFVVWNGIKCNRLRRPLAAWTIALPKALQKQRLFP